MLYMCTEICNNISNDLRVMEGILLTDRRAGGQNDNYRKTMSPLMGGDIIKVNILLQ